jgi:hypothetical protein
MKNIHRNSNFRFTKLCVALIAALITFATTGWGQSTSAVQDFEVSPALPTMTYSNTGGSTVSGNTGASDGPASTSQNTSSGGSQGWGANNTSSIVTFAAVNTTGYTGIYFSVRLMAVSVGGATNGMDSTDTVIVEVSPDGGTNYYKQATIAGNSNAYWAYSATGSLSVAYAASNSSTTTAPAGGGSRTTDGYSTLTITGLPAVSNLRVKVTLLNNATAEKWVIDDAKLSGTSSSGQTPPTLTAAGSATVDGAFDVTFTDNPAWRTAITSITVGGSTLASSAYSVSAGKITFTPSASTLLQSSGSKSIVLNATGYTTATVSQTIGVGAANKLGVTTQPAAPASNGAVLATQPIVTVQDQFGNTVTTSAASITAAVGAGTWTIGGTTSVGASSGVTTFSGLTATSSAAVTGATISFTSTGLTTATSGTFNIPVPPPANDLSSAPTSITVNGGSVSGTTLAATLSSPFTTTTGSTDVWFSLTAPATGTINIATSATAQDLDLTVWSGSAPSATTGSVMTNGAASSDTTSESGTFSATLGTVYYIRVLKYSSTDTAGSFTITATMNGPYLMSSGNYSQNFADIANWGNNFASGTGAANYSAVAVNSTGTIPDGVKTTVSSATFQASTSSGGIQRGTGNLQFLSTGSNNATAVAVDLLLDFAGRNAGTITFDWACVFNSTGDKGGTLRVYTSTDGTTWTLLSGTSVSVVNNVASSGTVSTIQLPSSFNNNANARVRFYQYADTVGTTGSRPKISIDNLAVTSTAVTPSITIGGTTSGTATAFTTTYGTASAQQSFTIAGSNLTADISVGAVTGLEYSINSGSTWGTTQTITRSGTSASATLLVRLAATAVVGGSYDSQAIPLSSTGATTRNITTASTGNSVSKATPTISVAPTASAITYGQTLGSSVLSGGTASTAGTYAFTTPSTAPNAGTASQNVTFTPTETANYNTATTTVSVTVNAASLDSNQITLTPGAGNSYAASGPVGSTFNYSYAGRSANGITTSYSSATAPTAAGYYTVSATATGNYAGSNTADYFVAGPVAVADSRTKSAGNTAQLIPISELLGNDRRITSTGTVETTGLTVTGVTSGSGNNAEIAGVFIQFTPSSASTDTITYTVSYGGMTATGTVTITTETQAPTFTLQIVKVGTAAFAGGNTTVTHDFIGVPGQTYLVEYATDLNGTWTSAGNQSTGTKGSFSVIFTKSGDVAADWNAHMFFRATLVP